MKRLFSFLFLFFLAITSFAEQKEFQLSLDNNESIKHDPSDWVYVTRIPLFSIYIEKSMIGNRGESVNFNSYLEYKQAQVISGLDGPIKRIYSWGKLNCKKGEMMLLTDLYVDEQNKIVYRSFYAPNTNLTDMTTGNIRRAAYDLICKDPT